MFEELRIRATEGCLTGGGEWRPWIVTSPAGTTEVHARDLDTALEAVGLSAIEADDIQPAGSGFIVLFKGAEFRLAPSRP